MNIDFIMLYVVPCLVGLTLVGIITALDHIHS